MRWDCGIDLGTANARMALAGGGILLDEPARLALSDGDATLYAGETPGGCWAGNPGGCGWKAPCGTACPRAKCC